MAHKTANNGYSTLQRAVIRQATTLAHIPTPFLSAFLAVHLSAPLVANLDGGELSSQVMLLGREYYQRSTTTSVLLVYAPLALHILSTYVKRRLLRQSVLNPSNPTLSYSGYIAGLIIPTHVFISRYAPTLERAPISNLGPAELDYEFVKYGLAEWPLRSGLLLGGLVLATLVHAAEGWRILWRTYIKKSGTTQMENSSTMSVAQSVDSRSASKQRTSTLRRLLPALVPTTLVLSGVFVLWMEDPSGSAILPSTRSRFEAVYRTAWWWY